MNDSILWGAQLIELDKADLRATSEHGKKTHRHRKIRNTPPDRLQFDDQISAGVGKEQKKTTQHWRRLGRSWISKSLLAAFILISSEMTFILNSARVLPPVSSVRCLVRVFLSPSSVVVHE